MPYNSYKSDYNSINNKSTIEKCEENFISSNNDDPVKVI